MESTDTLSIIKESFELWYNQNIIEEYSPVSIAINYSDEQSLVMKAYHKVRIEVCAIGILNGKSFTKTLVVLDENYNHGVTSEVDAKAAMIKKLLLHLYSYQS